MSAGPATVARSAARRTAPARPAARPGARTGGSAPPIRLVRPRPRAARAPFVVLISVLLASGLVSLLLINTWLAQGSFALRQLQRQQTSLRAQTQALAQQIAAAQAPARLAARATTMGMVPAPVPVFKTTGGKVLGVPQAAPTPPPPTPAAAAPTTPAAPAAGGRG